MLAFLGWNPGTEQEIFSMHQLIESFSLERVNKAGAKYDHEKTKWYNQQYLRAIPDERLGHLLQDELHGRGIECKHSFATAVSALMKERAHFIREMADEGWYFFEAPKSYDEKTVSKKWNAESEGFLQDLHDRYSALEIWDAENCEKVFKQYLEEKSVGFGKVGPVLRLALTGQGMGPSMFEICALLDKQESVKRMNLALQKLPSHG